MEHIPPWILAALKKEKLRCHKCNNLFTYNHLKALGIRDSFKNVNEQSLFIELICSKCKEMTLFELQEMNLLDLSAEIIDGIGTEEDIKEIKEGLASMSDSDDIKKEKIFPKKKKRSKITLKEINDHRRFLNGCKTHEEVMIAMGISPEEIEKYNFKENKKKGKKSENGQ